MPILDWVCKESVVNYDEEVSFMLLKKENTKSIGTNSSILLTHGDNLKALKWFIPFYPDNIKRIYINPTYNTGNENLVFNDKVNFPKIKKWLEKVVERVSEDLNQHDKWLCKMYPRLKMFDAVLPDEGILFTSINNNELHNHIAILSDIFVPSNFLAELHANMKLKRNQGELGFRVYAHKFRHTFAVKAIMDNVPLNVLQQWLGHSSVFTTSIYTQITGMDTSEFMGRVR
jgi:adenine-specific DNA-methyltransferase